LCLVAVKVLGAWTGRLNLIHPIQYEIRKGRGEEGETMRRRFGRKRILNKSVVVLGLGALAVGALIMRRRANTDATKEFYSPTSERSGEAQDSSQEPVERAQQIGREEPEEVLVQDTEKAEGSITEDIRSIIRESIRRSQAGDRGIPPSKTLVPEISPDAEELPIEDYDSLSIAQIGPRLEGLLVEDLERLRDYESKNKNRKTLIARFERRLKEIPGEDMRVLRKFVRRSE
jgi:hypothetical protein